ncbi:MAG: methyltransferase domain-containing protein [Paracoccaceae bacterium]
MNEADAHYDSTAIGFLEALWGDGYLSPGGPGEVARVLSGLDLRGLSVLDIGSGTGGITLSLARDHGAAAVTGIDVEQMVCAEARARIALAGLSDRVAIEEVKPGPFPFADATFDLVFSKDSIVHIPDKESLSAEVFRVLKPGGVFAASDWLISHDGTPSPEMAHYIACEDLDFGMASPSRYAAALASAGFGGVRLTNRNGWYREEARRELARLEGPDGDRLALALGAENVEAQRRTWRAMIVVLDSGEHCPHHIRAVKPA